MLKNQITIKGTRIQRLTTTEMDFCADKGAIGVRPESAGRVIEMPVVAMEAADDDGLATVATFLSGSLRSNLRLRRAVDISFRPLAAVPAAAAASDGGGGGGLQDDVLGRPARVTSSLFSTTILLLDSVELLKVGGRRAVVAADRLLTLPEGPPAPPMPASSIMS